MSFPSFAAFFREPIPPESFSSFIPDHLKCSICLGVYRKAVQVCSSGHSFCEPCFVALRLRSSSAPCPQCRQPLQPKPTPNLLVRNFVDDLVIRCPNLNPDDCDAPEPPAKRVRSSPSTSRHDVPTAAGSPQLDTPPATSRGSPTRQPSETTSPAPPRCSWSGPFSSLSSHMSGCDFAARVSCRFVGCRLRAREGTIREHEPSCPMRTIRCPNCPASIMLADERGAGGHRSVCPGASVTCTNPRCTVRCRRDALAGHISGCPFRVVKCSACGAEVERPMLDDHIALCPLQRCPCPLAFLGCRTVSQRAHLGSHMLGEGGQVPAVVPPSCSETLPTTMGPGWHQHQMASLLSQGPMWTSTFRLHTHCSSSRSTGRGKPLYRPRKWSSLLRATGVGIFTISFNQNQFGQVAMFVSCSNSGVHISMRGTAVPRPSAPAGSECFGVWLDAPLPVRDESVGFPKLIGQTSLPNYLHQDRTLEINVRLWGARRMQTLTHDSDSPDSDAEESAESDGGDSCGAGPQHSPAPAPSAAPAPAPSAAPAPAPSAAPAPAPSAVPAPAPSAAPAPAPSAAPAPAPSAAPALLRVLPLPLLRVLPLLPVLIMMMMMMMMMMISHRRCLREKLTRAMILCP